MEDYLNYINLQRISKPSMELPLPIILNISLFINDVYTFNKWCNVNGRLRGATGWSSLIAQKKKQFVSTRCLYFMFDTNNIDEKGIPTLVCRREKMPLSESYISGDEVSPCIPLPFIVIVNSTNHMKALMRRNVTHIQIIKDQVLVQTKTSISKMLVILRIYTECLPDGTITDGPFVLQSMCSNIIKKADDTIDNIFKGTLVNRKVSGVVTCFVKSKVIGTILYEDGVLHSRYIPQGCDLLTM